MTNKTIFPYKISHLEQRDGVEYIACKNATIIHVSDLDKQAVRELSHPAKINGFIAVVCIRGSLTLTAHMTDYHLTKNTILIAPTSVVQFKDCDGCELFISAFNSEFVADMNIDMRMVMPIVSSLHAEVVFQKLDDDRMGEGMSRMFASFYKEYTQAWVEGVGVSVFKEMAIRHMYAALIYRLCEAVACLKNAQADLSPKDRSSDYFKQLISLLHEHYKTERSVEFYAGKMNLTPKHLSRVVRNYSGKSVHQWIDEFVVLEIKNLLKYSDLSIQQISYELNFPNPSFMGQYFKRITGKTPGEYRREI